MPLNEEWDGSVGPTSLFSPLYVGPKGWPPSPKSLCWHSSSPSRCQPNMMPSAMCCQGGKPPRGSQNPLHHEELRPGLSHPQVEMVVFINCLRVGFQVLLLLLLLLLLSHFSLVRLCATPEMAAHQAPPSLGFSRQEHWSGLPFPSPTYESER